MEQANLYLDIDQTLSPIMGQLEVYRSLLNLHKELPDEVIQRHIEEERTFLPERQYTRTFTSDKDYAYLVGVPVEITRFQEARKQVLRDPEGHKNYPLFPYLPEGVIQLLGMSNTTFDGFYTVRPHEVLRATQLWLEKHNFPDYENVTICDSHLDKLTKIMAHRGNNAAILVDDNAEALAKEAKNLADTSPEMKNVVKGLVLVGFGLSEEKGEQLRGTIDPNYGIHVYTLPSWHSQNVAKLQSQLAHAA